MISLLRNYWSVVLLALASIALLSLGAPAKEAMAGAGFAFVGAAVTRGIDLAKERRSEAGQADASRGRDLDETRRLAYAALAVGTAPGNPVLVATLVNALAHHGSTVDPEIAARHIAAVVNSRGGESERWLREQIDQITDELEVLCSQTRRS